MSMLKRSKSCVHLRIGVVQAPIVFFFKEPAPTEIYTLSLHDALPISRRPPDAGRGPPHLRDDPTGGHARRVDRKSTRLNSSRENLVCRLLLEKKKNTLHFTSFNGPPYHLRTTAIISSISSPSLFKCPM